MTDLDREELRQIAEMAGITWQGTIGVAPKDVLSLLDALDEAEDQAAGDRADWQQMKVRASQRFNAYQQKKRELRRMEIRAEAAEAMLERVRVALANHPRTHGIAAPNYPCGWKNVVAEIEWALAPVTEEGDKE